MLDTSTHLRQNMQLELRETSFSTRKVSLQQTNSNYSLFFSYEENALLEDD